jgi:hypothetical protein
MGAPGYALVDDSRCHTGHDDLVYMLAFRDQRPDPLTLAAVELCHVSATSQDHDERGSWGRLRG